MSLTNDEADLKTETMKVILTVVQDGHQAGLEIQKSTI